MDNLTYSHLNLTTNFEITPLQETCGVAILKVQLLSLSKRHMK